MTIEIDNLVEGTWYDGFLWSRGRQRGVATMCWQPPYFIVGLDGTIMRHVDDASDRAWKESFEPNVESIGEPAA